jgi:hypothetical protein
MTSICWALVTKEILRLKVDSIFCDGLFVPVKHEHQACVCILNLPVLVKLVLEAYSARLAGLFMCTVTITYVNCK